MKLLTFFTGRTGLLLWPAVPAALAGCTTYIEQPRASYEPPPPAYVPPPPVEPQPVHSVEVVIRSESDFYEPLGAYGHWEVVGPYGRCWVPARVEADWRP